MTDFANRKKEKRAKEKYIKYLRLTNVILFVYIMFVSYLYESGRKLKQSHTDTHTVAPLARTLLWREHKQ